mmetsp:Transcript_35832/g.102361  ORF Transcript_35832/g.102361 Transcript_35832/m.102361 type:complete len:233 (-) Transcript_35832:368-1066(-)
MLRSRVSASLCAGMPLISLPRCRWKFCVSQCAFCFASLPRITRARSGLASACLPRTCSQIARSERAPSVSLWLGPLARSRRATLCSMTPMVPSKPAPARRPRPSEEICTTQMSRSGHCFSSHLLHPTLATPSRSGVTRSQILYTKQQGTRIGMQKSAKPRSLDVSRTASHTHRFAGSSGPASGFPDLSRLLPLPGPVLNTSPTRGHALLMCTVSLSPNAFGSLAFVSSPFPK